MYETAIGVNPYVSYTQSFTPQPGQVVSDSLGFANVNRRAAAPREGEQIEVGFKYQPKNGPLAVNAAVYDLKESEPRRISRYALQQPDRCRHHVRGFEIEAFGRPHAGRSRCLLPTPSWMPSGTGSPEPRCSVKAGSQVERRAGAHGVAVGIYAVPQRAAARAVDRRRSALCGPMTDVGPVIRPPSSAAPMDRGRDAEPYLFDAIVATRRPAGADSSRGRISRTSTT